MTNSAADAGIPLLTEILAGSTRAAVTSAATSAATPAQAAIPESFDPTMAHGVPELLIDFAILERQQPTTPSPQPEQAQALPRLALAAVSAQEWEQFEADITQRISRQILSGIDLVLEQRVRDSLATVLQSAAEGMVQDIQRGLQLTIKDVIGRAIAQKISELQKSKK